MSLIVNEKTVPSPPSGVGGLTRRIIPCLDIAGGRVVKGVKFVELRDAGDPVEQAKAYEAVIGDA